MGNLFEDPVHHLVILHPITVVGNTAGAGGYEIRDGGGRFPGPADGSARDREHSSGPCLDSPGH